MNLLLDTHALLWSLYEPRKLSKTARKAIEEPENAIFFSSISSLEIAIKVGLGKLTASLREIEIGVSSSGFKELPFITSHARVMQELPSHHSDPFDRALISQAKQERLVFVSCDPQIRDYSVELLW